MHVHVNLNTEALNTNPTILYILVYLMNLLGCVLLCLLVVTI